MSPDKLKSLFLGNLGRPLATQHSNNEVHSTKQSEHHQAPDNIYTAPPFPSFPVQAQDQQIDSLPKLSEITEATFQSRNPHRPKGPYSGYFDELGAYIWVDEYGKPFARRPPVNYHKQSINQNTN